MNLTQEDGQQRREITLVRREMTSSTDFVATLAAAAAEVEHKHDPDTKKNADAELKDGSWLPHPVKSENCEHQRQRVDELQMKYVDVCSDVANGMTS